MKKSLIKEIINRLEIMTQSGEEETRRFEYEGTEKCQVTYLPTETTFVLLDSEQNTEYRFDDIDLVAVEIFELLG